MPRMFALGVSLIIAATLLTAQVQVGGKVPDFRLTDTGGNTVNLAALKGGTTVLMFVATKCPVSNAYNERMNALHREYSPRGVKFVFINSNSTEPATEVADHARLNFVLPVYKDDNNAVADQLGAQVTPEAFVIDAGGSVLYHGSIDDSQNVSKIQYHGLRSALDAVLGGRPVERVETKAFGCTIKRVKK